MNIDKQLKKRLVGAVVLVSLGVIFIPVLLDGSGYKSRHSRSIEIPKEPEFAPLTQLEVEKIKTPIEIRKEQTAKQSKSTEKEQSAQKKKASSSVKKEFKKKLTEPVQAWALQVATFSKHSNALVLQDKLRADKFPAYVSAATVAGKQKYKVKIGPFVSKDRVEKLKQTIKKTQKLNGFVVRHP